MFCYKCDASTGPSQKRYFIEFALPQTTDIFLHFFWFDARAAWVSIHAASRPSKTLFTEHVIVCCERNDQIMLASDLNGFFSFYFKEGQRDGQRLLKKTHGEQFHIQTFSNRFFIKPIKIHNRITTIIYSKSPCPWALRKVHGPRPVLRLVKWHPQQHLSISHVFCIFQGWGEFPHFMFSVCLVSIDVCHGNLPNCALKGCRECCFKDNNKNLRCGIADAKLRL